MAKACLCRELHSESFRELGAEVLYCSRYPELNPSLGFLRPPRSVKKKEKEKVGRDLREREKELMEGRKLRGMLVVRVCMVRDKWRGGRERDSVC